MIDHDSDELIKTARALISATSDHHWYWAETMEELCTLCESLLRERFVLCTTPDDIRDLKRDLANLCEYLLRERFALCTTPDDIRDLKRDLANQAETTSNQRGEIR